MTAMGRWVLRLLLGASLLAGRAAEVPQASLLAGRAAEVPNLLGQLKRLENWTALAAEARRAAAPAGNRTAYIFLVEDKIQFPEVWEAFFSATDPLSYRVLVHATSDGAATALPAFFRERLTARRPTEWCHLTHAQFSLAREALRDETVSHVVWMSGDALPLKSPREVQAGLLAQHDSSIFCVDRTLARAEMWHVLARRHALALMHAEVALFRAFREFSTACEDEDMFWAPLTLMGFGPELVEQCFMWTDWEQRQPQEQRHQREHLRRDWHAQHHDDHHDRRAQQSQDRQLRHRRNIARLRAAEGGGEGSEETVGDRVTEVQSPPDGEFLVAPTSLGPTAKAGWLNAPWLGAMNPNYKVWGGLSHPWTFSAAPLDGLRRLARDPSLWFARKFMEVGPFFGGGVFRQDGSRVGSFGEALLDVVDLRSAGNRTRRRLTLQMSRL